MVWMLTTTEQEIIFDYSFEDRNQHYPSIILQRTSSDLEEHHSITT